MTQTDKGTGDYGFPPNPEDRIANALEDANMINIITNKVFLLKRGSLSAIRMYLQEKYEKKIIDRVDYKYKEYSEYMRR